MYGAYIRTDSYFDKSELGSRGLPTGAELALLEPFRDRLPPELFTEEFSVPTTDGSGNPRLNLRTALRILREAGWSVQDGVLRNAEDRKSVVEGKGVSVRLDTGGRRIMKQKKTKHN